MTALIISGGQGQLRGLRGGGGRPQGDVGGVQADQAGVARFEGERGGGADAEFRAFRVPGELLDELEQAAAVSPMQAMPSMPANRLLDDRKVSIPRRSPATVV